MVGKSKYDSIISTAKPVLSTLPGGWEPPSEIIPSLSNTTGTLNKLLFRGTGGIIQEALSYSDCRLLIDFMKKAPRLEPVTVQGMALSYNSAIGSQRSTVWSPELAKQLWAKMGSYFHNSIETFNEFSPTDWHQGNKNRKTWCAIGISPMLRFMRYEKGGQHYAHYDAGFIYPNDNYRTLKSVVIYLTTSLKGGATRFINDGQQNRKVWDRKHEDWSREVALHEVLAESPAIAGNVLIFDHRRCHDVQKFTGDSPRIIIRTDIIYKAVRHSDEIRTNE